MNLALVEKFTTQHYYIRFRVRVGDRVRVRDHTASITLGSELLH